MNGKLIGLLLFAFILVTSGCLDQAVDEQMPEEDLQNMSPENQDTQDTENTSEETEVDRTIEVEGGSYYYEPDNIEVEQGETIRVTFVNEGGQHDLRIPELEAETSVISGGESESFTVTFEQTGEYEFLCTVGTHAQQGMTGTITVS